MRGDELIRAFHSRHAGASSHVFGGAGDVTGASYRRLAEAVDAGPVLDLACGDGPLTALLRGRGLRVVGADRSIAELQRATARRIPGVAWVAASAVALPFAEGAFTTVACHMALMLLAPLEAVVDELARVLRPGGCLVATIGDLAPPSAAVEMFWSWFDELAGGGPELPSLGDPRLDDAAARAALFAGPAWGPVRETAFTFTRRIPADAIETWVEHAFYHVSVLEPAARHELTARIAAHRARLAPHGHLVWTFGARQLVVPRASS